MSTFGVDQLVYPIGFIDYDEHGHAVRVVAYSTTEQTAVTYDSLVAGDPAMNGMPR